jgi:hypothetical protein
MGSRMDKSEFGLVRADEYSTRIATTPFERSRMFQFQMSFVLPQSFQKACLLGSHKRHIYMPLMLTKRQNWAKSPHSRLPNQVERPVHTGPMKPTKQDQIRSDQIRSAGLVSFSTSSSTKPFSICQSFRTTSHCRSDQCS